MKVRQTVPVRLTGVGLVKLRLAVYWLAVDGTAVSENALTDGSEPMVPLKDCVCAAPAESFACNAKVKAPPAVAFPLMVTVVAVDVDVIPAGSVPLLTANVYGGVPPDAVQVLV